MPKIGIGRMQYHESAYVYNKIYFMIYSHRKKVKKKVNRNIELGGKFKTESPSSISKIKSSTTSNECMTNVIFLAWYMTVAFYFIILTS